MIPSRDTAPAIFSEARGVSSKGNGVVYTQRSCLLYIVVRVRLVVPWYFYFLECLEVTLQ